MTIEQLDLAPEVEAKARELQQAAPGVVFLSGRRTLEAQARAMSQNTVLNRQYIRETYTSSALVRALQRWVDTHPEARSEAEIAAGLLRLMKAMPEGVVQGLSKHLTGRAFDVQPHSCTVEAIEALEPHKFLQREANLVRWHVSW